ncbi:hypothetical protein BH09BAC2_BH09BAC2_12550 [soil metagenome]
MDDKTKVLNIKKDPKTQTTRVRGLKFANVLIPAAGGVSAVGLFSSFTSGPSPIPGVELNPLSDHIGEIPQPEPETQTHETATESHHSTSNTAAHEMVIPSDILLSNNFDNLSFQDAFAAATESGGPGKIFIYQGVPVLTTTSEDFTAMSSQEQSNITSQVDLHPVVATTEDDDDIFGATGQDDNSDPNLGATAGTIEHIDEDGNDDDNNDNATAANTNNTNEEIDVTEITTQSTGEGAIAINDDDDIWSNTGAEDNGDVALNTTVTENQEGIVASENIFDNTGTEDNSADVAMNGGTIETVEIDENEVAMNDNRDNDNGAVEINDGDIEAVTGTDDNITEVDEENITTADNNIDESINIEEINEDDDAIAHNDGMEEVTLQDDEDSTYPEIDNDDDNNQTNH